MARGEGGGGGQKRLTFPGVKAASDVELGGLFFFGLVTKMAGAFVWTPYFYQLLLPIVDPAMSGIKDNTRMGYYDDVARNTNMYAFGPKNRGGTCGHVFRPTTAEELLVWDGIVCQNLNTNISECWMMNQSNTFDREIMEAMHFRRWLDINACLKQNPFWEKRKKQTKDMIQHRSTA